MNGRNRLFCGVALCALFAAGEASAQTSAQVSSQMQSLQQQIQQLQQQLQSLQSQVAAQAQQPKAAATPAAAAEPRLTESSGHRFSIESPDGRYSIGLSMQLHFDAGDYLSYHPDSKATSPHDLNSGINARRARFGFLGKLDGDWFYTFVYDFGGSQDSGSGGTNSAGIEKAYLTYNGLYHGPFPLAFDLGYQDVPFTLDEATSSNDIMFMERASSQVIAANIAGGDNRSAFGVRSNDSRYWAGIYVTGPTSGTTHSSPEQYGAFGRVAYQMIQAPDYSLHLGLDAEGLMKPATSGGIRTISLSDRPEIRIDPSANALLNTGALGNAANPLDNAAAYGVELAGTYQNLFVQSEGYSYNISRVGLPANTFWGGYVEGAWTLTGEEHHYNPGAGAYGGINPAHPFSLTRLGLGAWELAARYSYINLNDNTGSAGSANSNGVAGGRQQVVTLGVNWYPNNTIRFMLNYLHGVIDKPGPTGEAGASFDALAVRTQIAF